MSDLISIVTQLLGSQQISQISDQLGESPEATKSAIDQALPLLVGALGSNSNASSGWAMLSSFLDADKDGNIIDDIAGMVLGGGTATASPATAGEQVLSEMFGSKQPAVQKHLEAQTQLSSASVAKLLPILAPLVIGALAKMQKTNNLNQGDIGDLLKIEREKVASTSPEAGNLLSSLLDRDGDGSIVDDLASMGSSLLGKMLR